MQTPDKAGLPFPLPEFVFPARPFDCISILMKGRGARVKTPRESLKRHSARLCQRIASAVHSSERKEPDPTDVKNLEMQRTFNASGWDSLDSFFLVLLSILWRRGGIKFHDVKFFFGYKMACGDFIQVQPPGWVTLLWWKVSMTCSNDLWFWQVWLGGGGSNPITAFCLIW